MIRTAAGALKRKILPRSRRGRVLLLLTVVAAVFMVMGLGGFAEGSGTYAPTCDGRWMRPGDTCLVSGGGDSYTYAEAIADHYRNLRTMFGVALPLTLVFGLATFMEGIHARRER